jgi:hypothetical protein
VLCVIVIALNILTRAPLGSIIKAETRCTYKISILQLHFQLTFSLFRHQFCRSQLALAPTDHNSLSPPQITTRSLPHRSQHALSPTDHNSLSHPQITTRSLTHRSLTLLNSLVSYLLSFQVQISLPIDCVQSHFRDFSQFLKVNYAIANQNISRPNLSDPSHSLFTNHSVARRCTAGTADKRH